MTLQDFVNKMSDCALKHKFVARFEEGDVFEIMNMGEKNYSYVILTINSLNVNKTETKINCYLYYVDRLLEDESNRLEIWAVGADTLQKIITRIGYNSFDVIAGNNVSYLPFKEKFQDLCAGVYANIEFTILNNVTNCDTEIY